jgi:hypothetical protein
MCTFYIISYGSWALGSAIIKVGLPDDIDKQEYESEFNKQQQIAKDKRLDSHTAEAFALERTTRNLNGNYEFVKHDYVFDHTNW